MTFWNRRRQESLDEEIRDYIHRQTAENMAAGMSAEEARAAAQRKLGNTAIIKEDTRAAWGFLWLERLWQDIVYGFRMFVKNPGFTVVAVLSIALGTGANTAMFSVADRMILKPLPVLRPDEVMTVGVPVPAGEFNGLASSYPDYIDLRTSTRSLKDVAAYVNLVAGLEDGPQQSPHVRLGLAVSGNFFEAMGVKPALGRGFRPEEDSVPGRDAVLVLGYKLWQSSFGANAIVGSQVRLNGVECTVIGVAPEDFPGMHQIVRTEFYVPLAMWPRLSGTSSDPLQNRAYRVMQVKGRLKPGVTMRETQAELDTFSASLARAYPATNRNQPFTIRTELEARVKEDPSGTRMIALLMLLTVAVLMVACANLAGLLTSRAPLRAREIALKLSLGAGRLRLLRQLITESLLIALAGGLFGIAFGYAGIRLFNQMQFPTDLPLSYNFQLDLRVMLWSLAAALGSVFIFGLIPSMQTTRADLTTVTKGSDTSLPGPRRVRGRSVLVVFQVAVSLVLLTLAVYAYRGFGEWLTAGPGFRTDRLAVMTLDPRFTGRNAEQSRQFYDRLLAKIRALPGVADVTMASSPPRGWQGTVSISPEGFQWPQGKNTVDVFSSKVDSRYFAVTGIPLLRGRTFLATDTAESPPVAVINDTLARRYWGPADPIGKRFQLEGGAWVQIVGVARTSTYLNIGESPIEYVYLNQAQHDVQHMTVIAQTTGDARATVPALREAVRALDPDQSVYDAATLEELYQRRDIGGAHVILQCIWALGCTGLGLALIGLYGLMSYAVNRRTREIGIRIAIGAAPAMILRMFLTQGTRLVLAGIAVGIPLSYLTLAAATTIVSRVSAATDSVSFYTVVAALFAVALTAAFIPARRASRTDPNVALRYE